MLLSTGERISMALLSMAIRRAGGDAISFTGTQSGILTNDRHFDARIIEVRPFRIEDELARGRIVIVAGYQGMSYKREITTLGRGGSDTTAVALAAALGAEYCEIYTDVDGVYTADPRVVPDARRLGTLSYEEMQELAESGAKVLNAQAVEFAKEKGSPSTRARRPGRCPAPTRRATAPSSASRPPRHARDRRRRRQRARRAGLQRILEAEMQAGGAQDGQHRSRALLAPLDELDVAGKQLHVAAVGLTLVVSRENLHEEERVRRRSPLDSAALCKSPTRSARSASSAPGSTRRSTTSAAARPR